MYKAKYYGLSTDHQCANFSSGFSLQACLPAKAGPPQSPSHRSFSGLSISTCLPAKAGPASIQHPFFNQQKNDCKNNNILVTHKSAFKMCITIFEIFFLSIILEQYLSTFNCV
jgi:hypothetical protein